MKNRNQRTSLPVIAAAVAGGLALVTPAIAAVDGELEGRFRAEVRAAVPR